jgi:polar amino acid transport system substrate-binding protein
MINSHPREDFPMKITVAYMEEPPFYFSGADGSVNGADVEVAEFVLRAIGYTQINYQLTTFGQIMPGLAAGKWNMNVPIFVTPERSKIVDFSLPVWANGDGFIVAAGNPKGLDSYSAVARREDTKLGVMPATIQLDAARSSGVLDSQIQQFERQEDALEALVAGKIDAYAGTALGNRIVAQQIGVDRVTDVPHKLVSTPPVGAFAFAKQDVALRSAFNEELRRFLGSEPHRQMVSKYGFTNQEIDPILTFKNE